MKSDKPGVSCIVIDGQKILFFCQEDWKDILRNPTINDICISDIIEIQHQLLFVNRYFEICLGIGFISIFNKWISYIFLKTGEHFQRVHLERLTCKFCGWHGMTANPMVIDPYFGDGINKDRLTLIRYASRYPILKCPQCDSSLPRHPIWIEY